MFFAAAVIFLVFTFSFCGHPAEKITTKVDTVLAKVTSKDMVKDSDAVILGTVNGLKTTIAASNLRPEEKDIVTDVSISVEKYLSNSKNISAKEVVVRVLGGTIGNKTMISENSPVFENGQRVVVFLKKGDNDIFTVYGWAQGKYTVDDSNIASLGKENDIFKGIFGKNMTLNEFEEEIKTLESDPSQN